MSNRRTFNAEFKAETLRQSENGRKASEVCRELNLSPSVVANWNRSSRQSEANPGETKLSASERDELNRLGKRVREAEMQRDILKKRRSGSRRTPPEICIFSGEPVRILCPCDVSRTEGQLQRILCLAAARKSGDERQANWLYSRLEGLF